MFLAVSVVAALLAFFAPIARINSATCARILPGMTQEQACGIVGVPPGWYDGVGGIRTDSPPDFRDALFWIGLRGEILVDLDESGRVARATFYPARRIEWSSALLFWERFTRIKYMGLTVTARVLLFFGLTAIATLISGMGLIRAGAKNGAASHGVIGLILGGIVAAAMFSEDFVSNLPVTAFALSGPILGAFVGIIVGSVRGWLAPWPRSDTPPASSAG
jgi:hypothetical protein